VAWCGETPQLLFPSVWAERLSDAELRAYVGHELAHLVQPELRGATSLASLTSLVTCLGVGLALGSLWAGAQPGQHPAAFVALALEPLALTLLVVTHRLPRRRLLMRLEMAADRQAVDWGAPPQLLADTLVRLQEKPLRVSQPLYQRVLYALLLTYVPKAFSEHRIAVLRALPAPAQPRSTA
jgi:Zn-dependent protease with chaperone function